MCQDRLKEKGSLRAAGFPTTPFASVHCASDIQLASQSLGWPLVVKTARSGYDGKGQIVVTGASECQSAWSSLRTDRAIAERMIDFEAEVSVICARNAKGQVVAYPLLENEHARHILDLTRCPATPEIARFEQQAHQIASGIAEQFQVEGLFCVEFFVASGQLLINEIAPRPHNSGHLTIEAFTCSQFEQQLRAVCNLPLIEPRQTSPAAMANLLGHLWSNDEPNWYDILCNGHAHLHLYGKAEARPGRKMGHLTCLAHDSKAAGDLAKQLRDTINSPGIIEL
jgi:5-(carboxyamino)imidazole ribonucleotide synthase